MWIENCINNIVWDGSLLSQFCHLWASRKHCSFKSFLTHIEYFQSKAAPCLKPPKPSDLVFMVMLLVSNKDTKCSLTFTLWESFETVVFTISTGQCISRADLMFGCCGQTLSSPPHVEKKLGISLTRWSQLCPSTSLYSSGTFSGSTGLGRKWVNFWCLLDFVPSRGVPSLLRATK